MYPVILIQTLEKRNAPNAKVFRQIIFHLKDKTRPKGNSDVRVIYRCPHYTEEGESKSLKTIPCVGEKSYMNIKLV